MITSINNTNYSEFTENNEKRILYFTASWCGPCKMLAPIMDEIDFPVGKIDVDENQDLSAKFGIRSVPTLVYMYNNDIVNKTVGALPKMVIENNIKETYS